MATAGATRVKGVDAAYYMVKDIERATKFYTDLIGFDPTLTVPGSVAEWTFPGDETFGVYQPEDAGKWTPSYGMLFAVGDIKSALADYMQRGVRFDDDGEIAESPVCYMAIAHDTEGNKFIVHQPK